MLGTNPFSSASLAESEALALADVPESAFEEAFDALDAPKAGAIPRAMLEDVWSHMLGGRPLTADEAEACRATCHTDVSGMIARKEYMEAVKLMKVCAAVANSASWQRALSAERRGTVTSEEAQKARTLTFASHSQARLSAGNVKPAASYSSCEQLLGERRRHRRPVEDPQQIYRKPLTTSHEVGWHTAGPSAPSLRYADNHPRKQTEITINEGMSLEKYYG